MKKKRLISGLLVVVMAASTLFGCGSSKEQSETKEDASEVSTEQDSETEEAEESDTAESTEIEQTLRLNYSDNDLNEYDFKYPWFNMNMTDSLLWLTLIEADKDLQAANPEIMSDWKVSDDGLEITMTMRDDLKWSDGEPITMDDILWTLEKQCSQSYTPVVHQALSYVEGQAEFKEGTADSVSGITADGNTLTFKLISPYASFLNAMSQLAPLPKHIYENCDFGENAAFQADPIWKEIEVNSGQYVVTEHEERNYIVLEPNPYYQGEECKIKKIEMVYTSDSIALAQNGEIDLMFTNSMDDYEILSGLDEYSMSKIPIIYFRFLAFNFYDENGNRKSDIDDVRIRQALAYAVDWNTIITSKFGEMAGFTQTGVRSTDEHYIGDWYSYNPEYAKQLLDEAGFDYNHVVKVFYYYDDQTTIDLMDAITYYLGQVGVQFEAVFTANSAVDVYEKRTQDATYFGLAGFDDLTWYQMYLRDNMDMMLGCKAIFEEAVKELETAYTEEMWDAAIKKCQELEKENVFFLPVYTLNNMVWTHSRLSVPEDCIGDMNYFHDYQFEEWEVVG